MAPKGGVGGGTNFLITVTLDRLNGLNDLRNTLAEVLEMVKKPANFKVNFDASSMAGVEQAVKERVTKGAKDGLRLSPAKDEPRAPAAAAAQPAVRATSASAKGEATGAFADYVKSRAQLDKNTTTSLANQFKMIEALAKAVGTLAGVVEKQGAGSRARDPLRTRGAQPVSTGRASGADYTVPKIATAAFERQMKSLKETVDAVKTTITGGESSIKSFNGSLTKLFGMIDKASEAIGAANVPTPGARTPDPARTRTRVRKATGTTIPADVDYVVESVAPATPPPPTEVQKRALGTALTANRSLNAFDKAAAIIEKGGGKTDEETIAAIRTAFAHASEEKKQQMDQLLEIIQAKLAEDPGVAGLNKDTSALDNVVAHTKTAIKDARAKLQAQATAADAALAEASVPVKSGTRTTTSTTKTGTTTSTAPHEVGQVSFAFDPNIIKAAFADVGVMLKAAVLDAAHTYAAAIAAVPREVKVMIEGGQQPLATAATPGFTVTTEAPVTRKERQAAQRAKSMFNKLGHFVGDFGEDAYDHAQLGSYDDVVKGGEFKERDSTNPFQAASVRARRTYPAYMGGRDDALNPGEKSVYDKALKGEKLTPDEQLTYDYLHRAIIADQTTKGLTPELVTARLGGRTAAPPSSTHVAATNVGATLESATKAMIPPALAEVASTRDLGAAAASAAHSTQNVAMIKADAERAAVEANARLEEFHKALSTLNAEHPYAKLLQTADPTVKRLIANDPKMMAQLQQHPAEVFNRASYIASNADYLAHAEQRAKELATAPAETTEEERDAATENARVRIRRALMPHHEGPIQFAGSAREAEAMVKQQQRSERARDTNARKRANDLRYYADNLPGTFMNAVRDETIAGNVAFPIGIQTGGRGVVRDLQGGTPETFKPIMALVRSALEREREDLVRVVRDKHGDLTNVDATSTHRDLSQGITPEHTPLTPLEVKRAAKRENDDRIRRLGVSLGLSAPAGDDELELSKTRIVNPDEAHDLAKQKGAADEARGLYRRKVEYAAKMKVKDIDARLAEMASMEAQGGNPLINAETRQVEGRYISAPARVSTKGGGSENIIDSMQKEISDAVQAITNLTSNLSRGKLKPGELNAAVAKLASAHPILKDLIVPPKRDADRVSDREKAWDLAHAANAEAEARKPVRRAIDFTREQPVDVSERTIAALQENSEQKLAMRNRLRVLRDSLPAFLQSGVDPRANRQNFFERATLREDIQSGERELLRLHRERPKIAARDASDIQVSDATERLHEVRDTLGETSRYLTATQTTNKVLKGTGPGKAPPITPNEYEQLGDYVSKKDRAAYETWLKSKTSLWDFYEYDEQTTKNITAALDRAKHALNTGQLPNGMGAMTDRDRQQMTAERNRRTRQLFLGGEYSNVDMTARDFRNLPKVPRFDGEMDTDYMHPDELNRLGRLTRQSLAAGALPEAPTDYSARAHLNLVNKMLADAREAKQGSPEEMLAAAKAEADAASAKHATLLAQLEPVAALHDEHTKRLNELYSKPKGSLTSEELTERSSRKGALDALTGETGPYTLLRQQARRAENTAFLYQSAYKTLEKKLTGPPPDISPTATFQSGATQRLQTNPIGGYKAKLYRSSNGELLPGSEGYVAPEKGAPPPVVPSRTPPIYVRLSAGELEASELEKLRTSQELGTAQRLGTSDVEAALRMRSIVEEQKTKPRALTPEQHATLVAQGLIRDGLQMTEAEAQLHDKQNIGAHGPAGALDRGKEAVLLDQIHTLDNADLSHITAAFNALAAAAKSFSGSMKTIASDKVATGYIRNFAAAQGTIDAYRPYQQEKRDQRLADRADWVSRSRVLDPERARTLALQEKKEREDAEQRDIQSMGRKAAQARDMDAAETRRQARALKKSEERAALMAATTTGQNAGLSDDIASGVAQASPGGWFNFFKRRGVAQRAARNTAQRFNDIFDAQDTYEDARQKLLREQKVEEQESGATSPALQRRIALNKRSIRGAQLDAAGLAQAAEANLPGYFSGYKGDVDRFTAARDKRMELESLLRSHTYATDMLANTDASPAQHDTAREQLAGANQAIVGKGYESIDKLRAGIRDYTRGEKEAQQAIRMRVAEQQRGLDVSEKQVLTVDKIVSKFKTLSIYLGTGMVLWTIIGKIKEAVSELTALDKSMAELQGTMKGHSVADRLSIQAAVLANAREYGVHVGDMALSAKQFAQAGTTPGEMGKMLAAQGLGETGLGMSQDQTADLLLETRNLTGGRVSPEDILDRIAAVTENRQVSPSDLARGIARSGQLGKQFQPESVGGIDFMDVIMASQAQIQERTKVAGDQAANSLNFMLTRLSNPATIKKLQSDEFGLKLAANPEGTQLRPLLDILSDIAAKYNELKTTDSKKADDLLGAFGGARQMKAASALFDDFAKVLQTARESSMAFGEAQRRLAIQQDTVAFKMQQAHNAFIEFMSGMANNVGLVTLAKGAAGLVTRGLSYASGAGLQNETDRAARNAASVAGAAIGLVLAGKSFGLVGTAIKGAEFTGLIGNVGRLGVLFGEFATPVGLVLASLAALGIAFEVFQYHLKQGDRYKEQFGMKDVDYEEVFGKSPQEQAFREKARGLNMDANSLYEAVAAAGATAEDATAKKLGIDKSKVFTLDDAHAQTNPLVTKTFQAEYVQALKDAKVPIEQFGDAAEQSAGALDLLKMAIVHGGMIGGYRTAELQDQSESYKNKLRESLNSSGGLYEKETDWLKGVGEAFGKIQHGDFKGAFASAQPQQIDGYALNLKTAAYLSNVAPDKITAPQIGGLVDTVLKTKLGDELGDAFGSMKLMQGGKALQTATEFLTNEIMTKKGATLGMALDDLAKHLFAVNKDALAAAEAKVGPEDAVGPDGKRKFVSHDQYVNALRANLGQADSDALANRDLLDKTNLGAMLDKFNVPDRIRKTLNQQRLIGSESTDTTGGNTWIKQQLDSVNRSFTRMIAVMSAGVESNNPELLRMKAEQAALQRGLNLEAYKAATTTQASKGLVRDRVLEQVIRFGTQRDETAGAAESFARAGIGYDALSENAGGSQALIKGLYGARAGTLGDLMKTLTKKFELDDLRSGHFISTPNVDEQGNATEFSTRRDDAAVRAVNDALTKNTDPENIKALNNQIDELRQAVKMMGDNSSLFPALQSDPALMDRIQKLLADPGTGADYKARVALAFDDIVRAAERIAKYDEQSLVSRQSEYDLAKKAYEIDATNVRLRAEQSKIAFGSQLVRAQGDPQDLFNIRAAMIESERQQRDAEIEARRRAAADDLNRREKQGDRTATGAEGEAARLKLKVDTDADLNTSARQARVDQLRLQQEQADEVFAAKKRDSESLTSSFASGAKDVFTGYYAIAKHAGKGRGGAEAAEALLAPGISALTQRMSSTFVDSLIGPDGLFGDKINKLFKQTNTLEFDTIRKAHVLGITEGFAEVQAKQRDGSVGDAVRTSGNATEDAQANPAREALAPVVAENDRRRAFANRTQAEGGPLAGLEDVKDAVEGLAVPAFVPPTADAGGAQMTSTQALAKYAAFKNLTPGMAGQIIAAADAHGVPRDLAFALVRTESEFNPNAKSKAGALGLGQLMPDTAAGFGLTGADVLDPAKNLEGSMTMMRGLLQKTGGNVPAALVGYNWGPGHINDSVLGGDLSGTPKETQAYVKRIQGLMAGNAEGATLSKPDFAIAMDTLGQDFFKEFNKSLTVTGTDTKAHTDQYGTGGAFDVRTKDLKPDEIKSVIAHAQALGMRVMDFSSQDTVDSQSAAANADGRSEFAATGTHLHIDRFGELPSKYAVPNTQSPAAMKLAQFASAFAQQKMTRVGTDPGVVSTALNLAQMVGITKPGSIGSQLKDLRAGGKASNDIATLMGSFDPNASLDDISNAGKATVGPSMGTQIAGMASGIAGNMLGGLYAAHQHKGANFGQEGAAVGSALGNLIPIPIVGPLLGGVLGGMLGSIFGKHQPKPAPEYAQVEKIERNTRESVTAIENQTRQMLSLDNRLLNVPASFVVPNYRPLGVGSGAPAVGTGTDASIGSITFHIHDATDPQRVAQAVAETLRTQMRGQGTFTDRKY